MITLLQVLEQFIATTPDYLQDIQLMLPSVYSFFFFFMLSAVGFFCWFSYPVLGISLQVLPAWLHHE